MNILKNKIVHCETEEQAKKLMQIGEDQGYIWHSGEPLTHNSYFQFTCGLGIVYYFDDFFEFEVAYTYPCAAVKKYLSCQSSSSWSLTRIFSPNVVLYFVTLMFPL